MGPEQETFDYIIIGAGIAGTVVASRLSASSPSLKIFLLEAGKDESSNPNVASPLAAPLLKGSECDWNYYSVPQKHLNGQRIWNGGGKAMGGGSVINYGTWHRGDRKDYDVWGEIVGDEKWGYQGFLPYFRKTENYYDKTADPENHGFDGPVPTASVTSSARTYPLAAPLKAAWGRLGIPQVVTNNGNSLGLAEIVEARTNGTRVVASSVYSLSNVTIKTRSLVQRILLSPSKRAIGVELDNGTIYHSSKEIILSAGSIRTPQVLMLSGIGPLEELQKHGIQQIVDSPEIGKNLWDHIAARQYFRLRKPELGASFGSPAFPGYTNGNPFDWWVSASVSEAALKKGMRMDGVPTPELLGEPRPHLGIITHYVGGSEYGDPVAPMDGTHVTTIVMVTLPTSRGSVTLRSSDPKENPITDPNFYATETDRVMMREGIRLVQRMVLDTEEGRDMFEGELCPKGKGKLGLDAGDEEIDWRVRVNASSIQHPAGTAAMGKVVDTYLKVMGVEGLRVVDASVIPTPISSPIQPCIYALGERAADLILGK